MLPKPLIYTCPYGDSYPFPVGTTIGEKWHCGCMMGQWEWNGKTWVWQKNREKKVDE